MNEITSRTLFLDAGKSGLHLCDARGTRVGVPKRDVNGMQIDKAEHGLFRLQGLGNFFKQVGPVTGIRMDERVER